MSPAAVARRTDGELVGKEPRGLLWSLAEREMGIPRLRQIPLQGCGEVVHLVSLRPQPAVVRVGKDGVQQHQPLDKSTK